MAKAGLRSGDVITRVGGAQVRDTRDLARKIAEIGPNKAVDLTIVRDGKEQTLTLMLGQPEDEKPRKASTDEGGESGLAALLHIEGCRAWVQNDPKAEPKTMTASRARNAPTIPTITMSK